MPRAVLSACRVVEPYNPSTLTQSMALSPGIRLGAYEALALPGQGGTAEMCFAEQLAHERES